MKKAILVFVFFVTMTGQASAAGVYDGIWSFYYHGVAIGYASVHQSGDQIIAISLDNDLTWEASAGTLVGNTIAVETIVSNVSAVLDVVFTSSTTLTMTQRSCVPIYAGYYCTFPNGAFVTGQKIF